MKDPARIFEIAVLRPIWAGIVLLAVFSGIRQSWWWAAGAVAALLYVGSVGAKLHPRQSAAELATGPLEGTAARRESSLLSPSEKLLFVGQASTRLAILVGLYAFAVAHSYVELPWYWCIAIAWGTFLLAGASLKLAFRVV